MLCGSYVGSSLSSGFFLKLAVYLKCLHLPCFDLRAMLVIVHYDIMIIQEVQQKLKFSQVTKMYLLEVLQHSSVYTSFRLQLLYG